MAEPLRLLADVILAHIEVVIFVVLVVLPMVFFVLLPFKDDHR